MSWIPLAILATVGDGLRAAMSAADAPAVIRFRLLHVGGMLLNVVQLGALAAGMGATRLSF